MSWAKMDRTLPCFCEIWKTVDLGIFQERNILSSAIPKRPLYDCDFPKKEERKQIQGLKTQKGWQMQP